MRYRFDECLEWGKIVKIHIDPTLVEKELREAEADLAAAERSLLDLQEKWAIIQGYYSIFHSLIYHWCLVKVTVRRATAARSMPFVALFIDEGVLDPVVLEHFSFAMDLREGADYGCIYNAGSANIVVKSARTVYEPEFEDL